MNRWRIATPLSWMLPFGNVCRVSWSREGFRRAAEGAGLVHMSGRRDGKLMTRELARKTGWNPETGAGGITPGQLSKIWNGEDANPSLKTTTAIARALGEHGRALLQSAEDTSVLFSELSDMVFQTPALRRLAVAKAGELTVGDLLRYRAEPSNAGEEDDPAIWAHIIKLRRGPVGGEAGTDVTDEEATRVHRARRRRG